MSWSTVISITIFIILLYAIHHFLKGISFDKEYMYIGNLDAEKTVPIRNIIALEPNVIEISTILLIIRYEENGISKNVYFFPQNLNHINAFRKLIEKSN